MMERLRKGALVERIESENGYPVPVGTRGKIQIVYPTDPPGYQVVWFLADRELPIYTAGSHVRAIADEAVAASG